MQTKLVTLTNGVDLARLNESAGVLGHARKAYEACLEIARPGQSLHNEAAIGLSGLNLGTRDESCLHQQILEPDEPLLVVAHAQIVRGGQAARSRGGRCRCSISPGAYRAGKDVSAGLPSLIA